MAASRRRLEVAPRLGLGYKGSMGMPKKQPNAAQQPGDVPTTELQERFGYNLRLIRKRVGLTQMQVAERSGIHQKEISQVELGKVNLTLGTMQRLAKVVDHDVTSLLGAPETLPEK